MAERTTAPTARARAEAAVRAAAASPTGIPTLGSLAAAASDEWEPLVREACALLRDHGTGGDVTRFLLRMAAQLDPADDARFDEHGALVAPVPAGELPAGRGPDGNGPCGAGALLELAVEPSASASASAAIGGTGPRRADPGCSMCAGDGTFFDDADRERTCTRCFPDVDRERAR